VNIKMSAKPGRSNRRSNLLATILELEEQRNILLSQQRELSQLIQQYNNEALALGARIAKVMATIDRLREEIRQYDEEEEEARRRNREELLRRKQELEEG
jgi:hypothetical protein